MSFQVGIDSLGGTMFFQAEFCTPLQTMVVGLDMVTNILNIKSVVMSV